MSSNESHIPSLNRESTLEDVREFFSRRPYFPYDPEYCLESIEYYLENWPIKIPVTDINDFRTCTEYYLEATKKGFVVDNTCDIATCDDVCLLSDLLYLNRMNFLNFLLRGFKIDNSDYFDTSLYDESYDEVRNDLNAIYKNLEQAHKLTSVLLHRSYTSELFELIISKMEYSSRIRDLEFYVRNYCLKDESSHVLTEKHWIKYLKFYDEYLQTIKQWPTLDYSEKKSYSTKYDKLIDWNILPSPSERDFNPIIESKTMSAFLDAITYGEIFSESKVPIERWSNVCSTLDSYGLEEFLDVIRTRNAIVLAIKSFSEEVDAGSTQAENPYSIDDLTEEARGWLLRKDIYPKLAKLLNDEVKPYVDGTGTKATWDSVHYLFKVFGIVQSRLSREKFATLLTQIVPGLGKSGTLESMMEKSSIKWPPVKGFEIETAKPSVATALRPFYDKFKNL